MRRRWWVSMMHLHLLRMPVSLHSASLSHLSLCVVVCQAFLSSLASWTAWSCASSCASSCACNACSSGQHVWWPHWTCCSSLLFCYFSFLLFFSSPASCVLRCSPLLSIISSKLFIWMSGAWEWDESIGRALVDLNSEMIRWSTIAFSFSQ